MASVFHYELVEMIAALYANVSRAACEIARDGYSNYKLHLAAAKLCSIVDCTKKSARSYASNEAISALDELAADYDSIFTNAITCERSIYVDMDYLDSMQKSLNSIFAVVDNAGYSSSDKEFALRKEQIEQALEVIISQLKLIKVHTQICYQSGAAKILNSTKR